MPIQKNAAAHLQISAAAQLKKSVAPQPVKPPALASGTVRPRKKLVHPTGGGIRNDSQGAGNWMAPRGTRKHRAVDFSASKGQDVLSPVDGKAFYFIGATTGYPIVDIIPSDASLGIDKIRMLYVDRPSGVKNLSRVQVKAGDVIGTASDLQSLKNFSTALPYPKGVTPHIHIQIESNGAIVNPTPYF